jgi:predicted ester cyclase
MSTDANKKIIRRLFDEAMNQGRLDVVDQFLGPSFATYGIPNANPGPNGFKEIVRMFRAAFPDISVTVEEILAEGDVVATRGTMRGTHRGEFMGVPPTGRRVTMGYLDLWRLADGRIIEHHVQMDIAGLMQQFGAMPPQPQAAQPRATPPRP